MDMKMIKKNNSSFEFKTISSSFLLDVFKSKNKESLVDYSSLTEEDIRSKADALNWNDISLKTPIFSFSDNFFLDFQSELNWKTIVERDSLKEDFIYKFADKLNLDSWAIIEKNLSESLLEHLIEYNDFNIKKHLMYNKKLSEKFIRKYLHKINDFDVIIKNCKVSIQFIREYKDLLNWKVVSYNYKNFSEKSLEEFKEYINWKNLTDSYHLSEDLIDKYKDYITRDILLSLKEGYIEAATELQKKEVDITVQLPATMPTNLWDTI